MLYDLETPSGVTLATCATELEAIRKAAILSLCGSVILITCVHLGSHSHRVAVLHLGRLLPVSSLLS